jgi:ceramide glucosyltransferase
VLLNLSLGALAVLSLVLILWQWLAAQRFPLHRRAEAPTFFPAVTLLKSLKGFDEATEACLRSWFAQDYRGPVQVLLGVASSADPVCDLVRKLLKEFPDSNAQLVVCGPLMGANAKVSKLAELEELATHDVLIVSDADVRVPPDFLANVVAPLQRPEVGLVNCFYRLANPATLAMEWEAVAINADFWSQVLQSASLRPLDFALGAVMVTRRQQLRDIGGFAGLRDCLADDYQLGHRIAARGHRIELCPVVVECWSEPQGWTAVWKHQLRWARTIRVCQPVPYFFSILSNGTLWPLLWAACFPNQSVIGFTLSCWLMRLGTAFQLQHRLTRVRPPLSLAWLPLLKDLLQAALWLGAFVGNHVEWRGQRLKLRPDGTLVKA